METLLQVPGYPRYQISNFGNVYVDGKLKKLGRSKSGYLVTKFYNEFGSKTMKVHRIVAKLFIGDYSDQGLEVNHKSGNKNDNSVKNLEWVTKRENIDHAMALGLLKRK